VFPYKRLRARAKPEPSQTRRARRRRREDLSAPPPAAAVNYPEPTDKVFPGNHIKMFNNLLTRTNLKLDRDGKPRTAYSLRHTYICMRLMEGADIYQIAKNCRTSVEMIERFYAAHIKSTLDAAAINTLKPRTKPKATPKTKGNAEKSGGGCWHRVESAGPGGPRVGAMQSQGSFSQAEYVGKKKQTRRDKFLAEMEQVVPWARLVERLRPLYPTGERGRPPVGLERMLRLYFLQQWYGLADEALEDALYDSQAMRGFAGSDLSVAAVPEATTVLNFRHWLEQHDLTKALFDEVGAMLEERGLLMRQGTIVDATIIAAPPSTKNKSKARDPEMHQTKKGNQWYFGMPFDKLRSAYRGGCRLGGGAHGHRHRRQRSRYQPDGGPAAWPGGGCLCRCRLYRSGQAARI